MTTPNYGWPFPAPASTVDVPRDIEALARAIDTSFSQALRYQDGPIATVFSNVSFVQVAVTFGHAFPTGGSYGVLIGAQTSVAYSLGGYGMAPISNTGFTARCFQTTGTAISISPNYIYWAWTRPPGFVPMAEPSELDGVALNAVRIVCETDGCPSRGNAVPLDIPDDVTQFCCGACGQQTTHVL